MDDEADISFIQTCIQKLRPCFWLCPGHPYTCRHAWATIGGIMDVIRVPIERPAGRHRISYIWITGVTGEIRHSHLSRGGPGGHAP